jgi:hypothetical protein
MGYTVSPSTDNARNNNNNNNNNNTRAPDEGMAD